MRNFNVRKFLRRIPFFCVLLILLFIAFFPIYNIMIMSFKSNKEIYSIVPSLWPKEFTFASYDKLFNGTDFLSFVKNTLIVALAVSVASIIISIMAGYGIARFHFKGKKGVSRGILYAYLMPRSAMYIPLYILITNIGLANTRWGLIVAYPTFCIPYATWMLVSHFKSIPQELEESAYIDGCARMRTLINIIVPVALPAIMAVFIFSITLCWGDYLYALVIITSDKLQTIPLGLASFIRDDVYAWGHMAAGAILSSLPVVILYMFASQHMIGGVTAGAVKG